jgi:hypothetical protein
MYINEILNYLMWPGLIIVTWYLIRLLLPIFEKKFAKKE